MICQEEIEAAVNEFPDDSLPGRLAQDTLRVRNILAAYMDAEHAIRWAFMQYSDGKDKAPDFESYADVKRLLIDPALEKLWPAADDSLVLAIMLHACLKTQMENTERYILSNQIVTRIVKVEEMDKLHARIRELEEKLS